MLVPISNLAGNLGSISAVVDSEPSAYSGSTTYTYDNADELKQEASHRNGTYTNNFSYDAAQNPTTSRSVSGKTYNSDNQSTNTGYAFDGSGNPTTYGGATLAFDGENRLTKYGTSTMSATYDATNLRASKTNSAGTTYYLYDGTLPVCEMSSAGGVAATNTFGAISLLSRHAGSISTFYTFDAQGNVSERLSSTGTVQTASTFDAFGLSTNTGTISDPFSYCAKWGYYTDSETGLQLVTYRYYDPSACRFLTRDPISYAGGINIYNYIHNNGVNLQDPVGTSPCSDKFDRCLDDAKDIVTLIAKATFVVCFVVGAVVTAISIAGGLSNYLVFLVIVAISCAVITIIAYIFEIGVGAIICGIQYLACEYL